MSSGIEPRLPASAHLLNGQVLSGRYALQSVIGSGGMASVFRAEDRRLRREVAVKVLHPHLASDPRIATRFRREAQYAARLSAHPNIVAIHDVGESTGIQYIVMELVEGQNLRDLECDGIPLSVQIALKLGRQVAAALDWAHEHNIVHRDVKPENILIAPGDHAKVTDFGIAHASDADRLTLTGLMIGTATYVSPEQAVGQPPSRSSDIYSLAVVLYEMLAGRPPFRADTPLALALMHAQEQPASPDRFNPQLPQSLSRALLRGLSKSPAERYSTASALVSAIEIGVRQTTTRAPLSIAARPTPLKDPLAARRTARFPLAVALFLCALAVAALIAWQASGRTVRHATDTGRPTATAKALRPNPTSRPVHTPPAAAAPTVAPSPTYSQPTPAPVQGQPTAAPSTPAPPQAPILVTGKGHSDHEKRDQHTPPGLGHIKHEPKDHGAGHDGSKHGHGGADG